MPFHFYIHLTLLQNNFFTSVELFTAVHAGESEDQPGPEQATLEWAG